MPGASVILPEEVKSMLKPERAAAIEAGAPVVVILKHGPGGLRVTDTKTFEKGYKVSQKTEVDPEELETLRKDFKDLLEVHDFLQDRVKTADKDWKKIFQEKKALEKEIKKRKGALKDIKKDLVDLAQKHKD